MILCALDIVNEKSPYAHFQSLWQKYVCSLTPLITLHFRPRGHKLPAALRLVSTVVQLRRLLLLNKVHRLIIIIRISALTVFVHLFMNVKVHSRIKMKPDKVTFRLFSLADLF